MAWSRLTEPEHSGAAELVRGLGAEAALRQLLEGRVDWGPRLAPRLELLDIDREVGLLRRIRARVVIPGDSEWPSGVDDLAAPPHCLWVRGPLSLGDACERSVSIVGARSATVYGTATAADLAAGLCERGFTVVSGAAFGIDAAAHRGALSAEGATVAVVAGGGVRPGPPAHEHLLAQIADVGLVVSEVPPGSAPTRHRFLSRNRLIATATLGTVVVEAGLRSGSLSTANQALRHHRVVAAVPGPVTSMVSAGCHQYIRDNGAVLVTDAAEAAEALGSIGRDLAPVKRGPERVEDALSSSEDRVLSSLAVRRSVGIRTLAVQTTMAERELIACLGRLELRGLAVRDGDGWRKRPRPRS
jgi:DNA processing protein